MNYPRDFLFEIPKSDLHLHLDGSLRLKTLIEASKKLNFELPSHDESSLEKLVFKDTYANLGEYLKGFKYTCNALRDLEFLEQVSYELAVDNQKENVSYIEVRFAPQLLIDPQKNLSFETIVEAVNKGLLRAKKEYNQSKSVLKDKRPTFDYGIITCAMRMFDKKGFSPFYSNLFDVMRYSSKNQIIRFAAMELVRGAVKLRDEKGIPIVAIDLAGQEEGSPPRWFKDAYAFAHKNFMNKTLHAGEAYGAESIFEAITECYADRIGHGYSLFMPERIQDLKITNKKQYIEHLSSFIADKRTVIEVCLTSNLQTNPELKSLKEHKFKDMLEHRIATSLCTDNRLISKTTLTKEYELATSHFNIPLKRLKDIVAYGHKKNFRFGTYVEKRQAAKENMLYFDKIAKKYHLSNS